MFHQIVYAFFLYISIHAVAFVITMPFVKWLDKMDKTIWSKVDVEPQKYDAPKMYEE